MSTDYSLMYQGVHNFLKFADDEITSFRNKKTVEDVPSFFNRTNDDKLSAFVMGAVPKLQLSLAELVVGALFITAGAIVLAALLGALALTLPFSATVAWVVVGLTMGVGSILVLDVLASPGFNFIKNFLTAITCSCCNFNKASEKVSDSLLKKQDVKIVGNNVDIDNLESIAN